jgi:hypothetical protein
MIFQRFKILIYISIKRIINVSSFTINGKSHILKDANFAALQSICPEITSFSPVCYHGYSNYLDSLFGRKKFMEKLCCIPCFPLTLPNEEGKFIKPHLKMITKLYKINLNYEDSSSWKICAPEKLPWN